MTGGNADHLGRHVTEGRLAGLVAGVWIEDEPVLTQAVGFRELATRTPMTIDSIFQIASMTKPIVATAVLQLVEEGRIGLDEPVTGWLPELSDINVLDDPVGSLSQHHPAAREITVDDLLTHRAGFTYAFTSSGPIADALADRLGDVLHTSMSSHLWLAALAHLPLVHDPGLAFTYGHSSEVLGCLIERIDGVSLGESLARRVFEPLGMTDTGFWVPPEKQSRLAHMYRGTDGSFDDVTVAPDAPPTFEAGGGGLYSTLHDYARFGRMLLHHGALDGTRVLRPGTVAMMSRNQLTEAQRRRPALGDANFFSEQGYGYGMGLVLAGADPDRGGEGAFSWGGVFGTWWQTDPKNRLVAVLLLQSFHPTSVTMNGESPTPPIGMLIRQEFRESIYGNDGILAHHARTTMRADPPDS